MNGRPLFGCAREPANVRKWVLGMRGEGAQAPPPDRRLRGPPLPIADDLALRHRVAMTWIGEVAEVVLQSFWEGAVEAAYRKWGWAAGALALFGPFVAAGLALWVIFR
jgi:hypothetical protein